LLLVKYSINSSFQSEKIKNKKISTVADMEGIELHQSDNFLNLSHSTLL
jgi:hypothetical protein